MHVCISVLIWVSAESQELLHSYNNFLFGFGYLHSFSFPVCRKEIVAFSRSCLSCYEEELLFAETLGNSRDLHQKIVKMSLR